MKFCFLGKIANSLKGETKGGAELQIALLAKSLALKGHEVVIIDPFSNENFVTKEGIRLIDIPDWNKGIRGIRLFLHRIPALKKALLEQKADYYYGRTRTYFHLLSYKAAKKLNSKFILAIASDIDILNMRNKIKYNYSHNLNIFNFLTLHLPNDLVFHYLIKHADYITIQHSGQNIDYKIKGKVVLFPNIIENERLPAVSDPAKDYFIHVGTLTMLKGVGNLYDLNSMLDPNTKIWIVGNAIDKKSNAILNKLIQSDNIVFKGRKNHNETMQLIANSKALINVSNFEGFPNIFLEAWATGVPVISLNVNPGNVFSKFNLGFFCDGSLEKMKDYMTNGDLLHIDKEQLLSYIAEFHSFSTAGSRFLDFLF
ncbi:MAG: glycosyltransferase [Bacteroidetes bacterium]|nr:glycosyltransferase [Bacteroidota bacterium]